MTPKQVQELIAEFRKLSVGNYPTPLEAIDNYSRSIGFAGRLYMKRDDMTADPGGNKTRHLEYIFAGALASQADLFVIACPLQTNFGTMSAILGRKFNFPVLLIHNSDPPSHYTGNALLDELMGVERIFLGDIDEFTRADRAHDIVETIRSQGKKPYLYGEGNSKPLSSMGYVDCVLELVDQMEKEDKSFDHLFLPGGTGTCEAGVIYGVGLLDKPFHLHIVSVEYEKDYLMGNLVEKVQEMEALTGVSLPRPIEELITIYDQYRGGGWAVDTPETLEAIHEMARTEGIFLEKIYTGKCVSGMKAILQESIVHATSACYLHTGGFPSLFSQL